MKQKTSITLSAETLHAIDELVEVGSGRSRLIEQAVCELLERRRRAERERRELEILDAAADELNREMEDVLAYQAGVRGGLYRMRCLAELEARQRRMETIEALRSKLAQRAKRPRYTPPEKLVREDRDR